MDNKLSIFDQVFGRLYMNKKDYKKMMNKLNKGIKIKIPK